MVPILVTPQQDHHNKEGEIWVNEMTLGTNQLGGEAHE